MKDIEVDNFKLTEQSEDPQAEVLADTPGDSASSLAQGEDSGPGDVGELKKKAAKADEHWDRLLRTTADFDNFRKRATKEKQEAIRFANEGLLEKLIPVLDSFDMAIAATQNPNAGATDSVQAGINMIHQQLKTVLLEAGLEEVDATGQIFDPKLHEAISQVQTADVPEGHVVQQVRKGYKLRDRLIRPASVVVAAQPAA